VGAVAREDADRFARLGVGPERVRVTGDARFDQVAARVARIDRDSPLLRALTADDPLVVAGSTWPADEAVLIPAFASAGPLARARLAIAPHEPTPRHVEVLARRLAAAGLAHERLGDVERRGRADARVIIIDRVGVLADLYAAGAIAYVGGGFGRRGLHSVIEPAATGIPVLYGPRRGNAREASELRDAGGAFEIVDTADCTGRLAALLTDRSLRARSGDAASAYVRSRLGGAAANAALVLEASTLTTPAAGP
jgi:3-deoxy-D-manno-octulosonic-acid transferase